jgi:hypothetical protein
MQRVLRSKLVGAAAFLASALGGGRAPGYGSPGETSLGDIVFSEIHYHPPGDKGKEEFLELHNSGVRWVDLGGWSLEGAVRFTLPQGTVLAPGDYLVVARDAEHLRGARGIKNVVGDYKGRLGNQGDRLEILDRERRTAAWLHYHDGFEPEFDVWPRAPDGEGPSLELITPHPDWFRAWHWAASRVPGGTPGRPSSVALGAAAAPERLAGLEVTEARLLGDSPFVELANGSRSSLKLDGARLTSDPSGKGGVPLSGEIAPGRELVLEGAVLEPLGGKDADAILLVEGDPPSLIASLPLKKAPPEGSVGRLRSRPGEVLVFGSASPGKANPVPGPSPLIINEVHYHESGDASEGEFIEVHNRSDQAVSLGGWSLERAASFTFPDGSTIPPRGYVVAALDPEKLKLRLAAGERDRVFGPLKGGLSNSGESILLLDPLGNDMDLVPYRDEAPWPAGADGEGFSMELIHPDLDNRWGGAWTEGSAQGSPCRKNVRSVDTMAPVIAGVRHTPPLPSPASKIVVHAQVLSTRDPANVAVSFRDANSPAPAKTKPMSDTGRSDDGAARDGHYAVALGSFRAGTLLAFSIIVKDHSGRLARAPAQPERESYILVGGAEREPSSFRTPTYHVLMPAETWTRFQSTRSDKSTWYPCTFVAAIGGPSGPGVPDYPGKACYDASIRYRGNNSMRPERNDLDGAEDRMSYRVRLDGGGFFDGRNRFVLNAFSSHRQKAALDVFRAAGLPCSAAAVVRLRTPTFDDTRYLDVEVVGNRFLDNCLGSSKGDLFRGVRGQPFGADLTFHGRDNVDAYLAVYRRENKKGDRDITALLTLLEALDTKDDAAYAERVEGVVDTAEWALYFAANNVLGNVEGGLSFDAPDDYFLALRPDGKWILVPWDNDSTFAQPRQELFRPRLPAIRRFLTHSAFAPLYHRAVRDVLEGPLSPAAFARWAQHYRPVFTDLRVAKLAAFVESRHSFLREVCPLATGVGFGGDGTAQAGIGFGARVFLTAASPEIPLAGVVDPCGVFGVRVGGRPGAYNGREGRWSAGLEMPSAPGGPGSVWVELLGRTGEVVGLESLNVERVGRVVPAPQTVSGRALWDPEGGPYHVNGVVRVPSGAALKIAAGTQVVCGPDAVLQVSGKLEVEGSREAPVVFRPAEGAKLWQGIHFVGGSSTLVHCRFEGGSGGAAVGSVGAGRAGAAPGASAAPAAPAAPAASDLHPGYFLRLDGANVVLDHCVLGGLRSVAVGARQAQLELRATVVADSLDGVSTQGGKLTVDGLRLSRLRGDGLRVAASTSSSSVRGVIIRDVLGSAIAVEGGALSIENALIEGAAAGLVIADGAQVRASHLTVSGTGLAVALDRLPPLEAAALAGGAPAAAPRGRSRLALQDSVLWPNVETISLAPGSRFDLSSSVVAGPGGAGPPPGASGVVSEPPRFSAPHRGDFRLESGSPGKGIAAGGADPGYLEPNEPPRGGPPPAGAPGAEASVGQSGN